MASDAADMGAIFDGVLDSMGEFPDVMGRVGEALEQFVGTVESLMATLAEYLDLEAPARDDRDPADAKGGESGSAVGPFVAIAALAKVAAVAALALGALAAAVGLVQHQMQKLQGYVRAFNPGVVTMFQQALENLSATIGRAFVPIFQNATEVVRQWAGILAPIMSALAPVVKTVSDLLANTLMRVLTQLGATVRASLPVFKALLDVVALVAEIAATLFNSLGQLFRVVMLITRVFYELSGLGTVVRILTKLFEAFNVVMRIADEALSIFEVVVTSLVDSLMAWIGSLLPFGDVMNSLNKAVEYVIRSMYVWAVQLAKMFGALGVVDALIAHVEGKTKTGDVAAQNPQIKGLEQLSKDLALAAASAGGAAGSGGVKNQQEFWQQTLAEMRAAKQNGMTIQELVEAILDEVRKLVPGGNVIAGLAGPPRAVVGPGGLPEVDRSTERLLDKLVNPFGAIFGGAR